MSSVKAWLKASRIQSQSYIFLPLFFGQAWAAAMGLQLDWSIFFIVTLFGLFDQLYIVYANDYADYETDCANKTYNIFSGGSRVLADKDLVPSQLKNTSMIMAGLCLSCGVVLTVFYNRPLSVPLILAALALLWMYSYRPFRLSYRGGGEFLQMTGVGLVLPLFGYYAQSGRFFDFSWHLLSVILPTQLACAMATSLPDEPSDKLSGKKTATVLLGQNKTKILIIFLNTVSIVLFPVTGWLSMADSRLYYFLCIPMGSVMAQFFFLNSRPGEVQLTLFVFLSVLTTLSIMGGMAFLLLLS